MFTLYVDFEGDPSSAAGLTQIFERVFRPAITQQTGLTAVDLQQARDLDSKQCRLLIAFATEADQKKWVSTGLHQQVWPQMEKMIGKYAVYSFKSLSAPCFKQTA